MTSDDKVRPLPPEPTKDSAATDGTTEATAAGRGVSTVPAGVRASVIAVAALVGGLAIGLLASGVGQPTGQAVGPTTTTIPSLAGAASPEPLTTTTTTAPPPTTTTLAPTLSERVPGLGGKLIAVGSDADGPFTATWLDGQRRPDRLLELEAPFDASLNADHSLLAYLALEHNGRGVLFAGRTEGSVATPRIARVSSFEWHDTQPERIAWTGSEITSAEQGLFVSGVLLGSRELDQATRVLPLSGTARLRTWGDWGFIIEDAPWLIHLDPSGVELTRIPATMHSTNGTSILAEWVGAAPSGEPDDGAEVAEFADAPATAFLDVPKGVFATDMALSVNPDTTVLVPGGRYLLSPDGQWAARITPANNTVEVHGMERRFRRILSFGGGELVGFSDSGEYLLLDRGQVVLLNWTTGRSHALPITGNIATLALED